MSKFILVLFIFLTGCSPFGNQSLIEDITSSFDKLFNINSSVLSSGSQAKTVPEFPTQQPYNVNHSVGETFHQTTMNPLNEQQTASGYKVFTSIQTETN